MSDLLGDTRSFIGLVLLVMGATFSVLGSAGFAGLFVAHLTSAWGLVGFLTALLLVGFVMALIGSILRTNWDEGSAQRGVEYD